MPRPTCASPADDVSVDSLGGDVHAVELPSLAQEDGAFVLIMWVNVVPTDTDNVRYDRGQEFGRSKSLVR